MLTLMQGHVDEVEDVFTIVCSSHDVLEDVWNVSIWRTHLVDGP